MPSVTNGDNILEELLFVYTKRLPINFSCLASFRLSAELGSSTKNLFLTLWVLGTYMIKPLSGREANPDSVTSQISS